MTGRRMHLCILSPEFPLSVANRLRLLGNRHDTQAQPGIAAAYRQRNGFHPCKRPAGGDHRYLLPRGDAAATGRHICVCHRQCGDPNKGFCQPGGGPPVRTRHIADQHRRTGQGHLPAYTWGERLPHQSADGRHRNHRRQRPPGRTTVRALAECRHRARGNSARAAGHDVWRRCRGCGEYPDLTTADRRGRQPRRGIRAL